MLRLGSATIAGLILFLILPCGAPCSRAQTEVSGRYQCAEAKVNGKSVPCKSAPLVLKEDGRYQIQGRKGNYEIAGDWLVLSDTRKPSRGRIAPGHRIVFEYPCGGGSCEVTFERRTAVLGKTSLS